MNATIFTEGGKGTGLGRIYRCSAIKRAFERVGIKTEFVVNRMAGTPSRPAGIRYTIADWRNYSSARFAGSGDIALIDSTVAGREVYERIAAAVKHCLYVDDRGMTEYPSGTVINYNAYASALHYPERPYTKYLLGPAYVPLRSEFWTANRRVIRKRIAKCMLIFDGAYATGLASAVLKFLADNYPEMKKVVVVGAGYGRARRLGRLKDNRTEFVSGADEAGIGKIMSDCDLAFTASGETLYELSATGTPAAAFCAPGVQERNLDAMVRAGAVTRVQSLRYDAASLKRVITLVSPQAVRERMSNAGRNLVDGMGAIRLAKYARNLLLENEVLVRRAGPGDVLPVYRLSNESTVREHSIHSGKIVLRQHKKWFMEKIGGAEELFLIAEYCGELAGQARFTIKSQTATVSISVVSRMRGSGVGGVMLHKAMEFLEARYPEVIRIMAYIKPDNIPSQKLFSKSGFKKVGAPQVSGKKLYLYKYMCRKTS